MKKLHRIGTWSGWLVAILAAHSSLVNEKRNGILINFWMGCADKAEGMPI